MADILTMVDVIYPKLRIFTNGFRAAVTVIHSIRESSTKMEKEPEYSYEKYAGGDDPRWKYEPDESKWRSGDDKFRWKFGFDLFDDDDDDDDDDVLQKKEKHYIPENNALAAVGKTGLHNNRCKTGSGKKSLRSRISSIIRRLTSCVPRKENI